MIVRHYLAWSATAPAAARAAAVHALARAWISGELVDADRREAEAALTVALDDGSPLVRRALAEALAGAEHAPRGLIIGLAHDLPEIAALVVAHSPMLNDADLVDLAALGETLVQTAIASRPHVPVTVAAALAEVADAPALLALVGNAGAEIADHSLTRMAERHAEDGDLCAALLALDDLPVVARLTLMGKAAERVVAFVGRCGWLSQARAARAAGEARDAGTVALAARAPHGSDALALAATLATQGRLTPQLLLRSLLSGDTALLTAALTHLSGMPENRVAAIVNARLGIGFPALYRRAGLPEALEAAFVAALAAVHEVGATGEARLSRAIIERVLTSPAIVVAEDQDRLLALLSRYQAEAAREEARALTAALAEKAVAPQAVIESDDLDHRLQAALAAEIGQDLGAALPALPAPDTGASVTAAVVPVAEDAAVDERIATRHDAREGSGIVAPRRSALDRAFLRLGFRRAA
jgi:uncharacterized protein (DUF2336 family)